MQRMTEEIFAATDPELQRGENLGASYRQTIGEVLKYTPT